LVVGNRFDGFGGISVTGYRRIWIYQLVKGTTERVQLEGAQRHLASRLHNQVNRRTTVPALLGKCFGTKHQMEDCGMVVWLQMVEFRHRTK
jgi:hypothetical protein